MTYQDHGCFKINVDRRAAFATIDRPPFNLMDMPIIQQLDRFSKEVHYFHQSVITKEARKPWQKGSSRVSSKAGKASW